MVKAGIASSVKWRRSSGFTFDATEFSSSTVSMLRISAA